MEGVCVCVCVGGGVRQFSVADGEINEQSSRSNTTWNPDRRRCHVDRVRHGTRRRRGGGEAKMEKDGGARGGRRRPVRRNTTWSVRRVIRG